MTKKTSEKTSAGEPSPESPGDALKAFVTGGSGFVGAAVIRALLARGVRVTAMAREPQGIPANLHGLDLTVWRGDLSDQASLSEALEGMDGLFHVAADYRLWARRPQEIYAANVDGSRRIMRAALEAGVARIVYTSSVATLGHNSDESPADEAARADFSDMIGDYKKSKFLAEEAVRDMAARDKLPAVIVNPSAPVGPRDRRPTPTGRMILEAARGRTPAYVDSGLNIVHVDDVAEGHILAFDKGVVGERYILGGENLTLEQIFRQTARLTGVREPMVKLPHWLILPMAYASEAAMRLTPWREIEPLLTVTGAKLARRAMFFDSSRASEALGYAPRPAGEALADAVGWFRQQGWLD